MSSCDAEIRMLNQIAAHFGYLPTEQAIIEIAGHVRKFWDPRMSQRLLDLIDSRADDLQPVALAAAALLR